MTAGQLRIHRGGGFTDRLRAYKILVDGTPAGEVRAKETATLSVAAGIHTVQLRVDWCVSRELAIDVAPGRPIDLSCRGHNPLLALYWITLGRARYIDLAVVGEPDSLPEDFNRRPIDSRSPSS